VVDGKLDDPCWQQAATLAGFVSHADGKPVSQQTVALVTHGERALCIAFRCSEERMDQLREKAIPDGTRTSPEVPSDDSVEVYIQPGSGGEYQRFAVNCAGVRKAEASGPWQSAAAKGTGEWTVELVIPDATLRATAPAAGTVWGLNVCRNQPRLGEYSSWSCTFGPYAEPARFGRVVFR
jgi:hypothetical protein